jgi:hypothetical protein
MGVSCEVPSMKDGRVPLHALEISALPFISAGNRSGNRADAFLDYQSQSLQAQDQQPVWISLGMSCSNFLLKTRRLHKKG